jgi:tetratricopeptide (TPR) repeat protein
MKNAEIFDKIEAYLQEDLNAAEKAAFEQEMAQNPDLAEQVEMHRFEWDGMEVLLENDLRSNMAQWQEEEKQLEATPSVSEGISKLKVSHKAEEKVMRLETAKSPVRRMYYNIAIAASFALLAGAVLWVFTKPNPQPTIVNNGKPPVDTIAHLPLPTPLPKSVEEKAIAHIEKNPTNPKIKPIEPKNTPNQGNPVPNTVPTPKNDLIGQDEKTYIAYAEEAYQKSDVPSYEDIQSTRGGGDEKDNVLEEAGKAYDKKDFDKAIGLLKNLPVVDENFNALEILAHSYFQKKNHAAALPIFQNLLNMSGKKSREKSEWYLLLCYLAHYNQHTSDFKTLANKVVENKDHTYFEKTTELLKRVNVK